MAKLPQQLAKRVIVYIDHLGGEELRGRYHEKEPISQSELVPDTEAVEWEPGAVQLLECVAIFHTI